MFENVHITKITLQLNKASIKNEFINFLNLIQKDNKQTEIKNLISFAFRIPYINISSLTDVTKINTKLFFYWKIESENEEFLGYDSVLEINEYDEDRIDKTAVIIEKLENGFVSNWDDFELLNVPLVMGANKFAPNQISEIWKDYSDSDWFIPKFTFYNSQNDTIAIYNTFSSTKNKIEIVDSLSNFLEFLEQLEISDIQNETINQLKDPIYSNSVDKWEGSVNLALKKIADGSFKKVVLSREISLQLNNTPSLSLLLKDLGRKYPRCYTFAFHKDSSIFLGASPEKLAKFSNNWIEVDALAGSAPRGKSEEEDLKFEQFLLNSKKNLNEQAAVVTFINKLLEEITDNIYYDKSPILRKLPNIQHLWTIIRAKLKTDYKLFEVLKTLHPTPAICGTPWKTARKFILDIEPHDRGMYSGNIGWFNFSGSGEFAVAIRSALIKDESLYAYAGCGIVEGSEAKAEFEESEIKLKPILSLFVDEKVYQP